MTRVVVLDTETTGLNRRVREKICDGHRIIELACVEVINDCITGRVFHTYINPNIDISEAATKVHGIHNNKLSGKPIFEHVIDDFLEFLSDSTIIIHNAKFDIAFLDQEFELLSKYKRPSRDFKYIDTLEIARRLFPGYNNTLDALAFRLGVTDGKRVRHGALQDAEILARVYILLNRI